MIAPARESDGIGAGRWRSHWISQLAHLLLLVGAAAAVFVAGRVHEGHFGVFLVVAGIAMCLCPPRVSVDWRTVGIGAALLVLCSAALLPQSWFPMPDWRARLSSTAFPAIASITPAPRETVFWLGVAAVAICVALFGLAHPVDSRALSVIVLAAVVICGIYTGLAIYAHRSGWEFPLTYNPAVFGFLPNRNHTATLLITGSLLALGLLGVTVPKGQWAAAVIATACLAACVTSLIFFSSSRGGVVFLTVGILLWFAGLGRTHRSKPLLISFGAIFAAAIVLFLVSKSAVLQRMAATSGLLRERAGSLAEGAEIPLDGRVAIFHDTLRLIRDFPITGTGLGTFRYAFAFYGRESLGFPPAAHPESDWLMLAAEAGIPALLVVAAGIGWLVCRAWRMRNHPAWPLRWGILCAALAAFLHGIVDSPAHRTALGWWLLVLLVAGLQLPPPRSTRSLPQRLLFVAGGLSALALGLQLLRAEWFGGQPSPPYAGFAAESQIIELRVAGNADAAVAAARQAIRASPMSAPLYFQLGVTLLEAGRPAEAEPAFAAQRLLDPNSPDVPFDQGALWIESDPAKTVALWLEAIERSARIDAARRTVKGATGLLPEMIRLVETNAAVQRGLLAAGARGPEFALAWIETAGAPVAREEFPRFAADSVFLASLDEAGRRRFLRAWYDRGERAALFEFIANHPGWNAAAWPVQIRQLIDAGKFEEAVKSVALHHKISIELPPTGSGGVSGAVDEANPAAAFDAYWRRENVLAARRVLDEARRGKANGDREIWRLSAALAANDGQWQAALQHLERYLQHSGLDSLH